MSKPGFARKIMPPLIAFERAKKEIDSNSQIKIVAVSGPGEPLANPETFQTLRMVREWKKDIHLCMSSNGTLVAENIERLVDLELETLTISMSTASPATASVIYEWAKLENKTLTGIKMGSLIVKKQLLGIQKAASAGIFVKVNTILIPTINQNDIIDLAETISKAGACLQNIVPLVPHGRLESMLPPTKIEIEMVRDQASEYIGQFYHCKQCRSDVVGIPGCDTIL